MPDRPTRPQAEARAGTPPEAAPPAGAASGPGKRPSRARARTKSAAAGKPDQPPGERVTGILRLGRGGGVLFDAVRPAGEVAVPLQLIRQHTLVEGASISGPAVEANGRRTLSGVDLVCGLPPEQYRARTPFTQLVAIDPFERFNLEAAGDPAMRIVDLLAPIGKGTRGLVVAPPKAGKTTLLEQIARGIRAAEPAARIVVLLIDERPEELTYFRRTVEAEVFASSIDQSPAEHKALAELMLSHVRVELECGRDVVVLLDSLTRLARSYNLGGTDLGRGRGQRAYGGGRTLSGGMDVAALEVPRRFLGAARKIENGGSVTVIASVLVDTGSRLDQVIYEEFKSTGNSEIVLDRGLAQERIFPAVDIAASGTRKEERLYSPEEARKIAMLRRMLAGYRGQDALAALLQLLARYPTNKDLLDAIR